MCSVRGKTGQLGMDHFIVVDRDCDYRPLFGVVNLCGEVRPYWQVIQTLVYHPSFSF